MARTNDELVHLVLQLAKEQDKQSTARELQQHDSVYFNSEYFGDQLTQGDLESVEKYLSKFTKPEDNEVSCQIFFELRQQKFLDALAKDDSAEALEILNNELQVFKASHKKPLAALTRISKKTNFSNHKMVSEARDAKKSRTKLHEKLVRLITDNPMFEGKLESPCLEKSRLFTVIRQALQYQHMQCKNPRTNPEFTSLYVDHSCDQTDEAPTLSLLPSRSIGINPHADESPPIGGDITALTQAPPPPSPMASKALTRRTSAPSGSTSKRKPVVAAKSKKKTTPPTNRNSPASKRNAITRRASKRQMEEDVDNIQQDQECEQNEISVNDIPLTVVASLGPESYVTSMDFHPVHQELLLVGTTAGTVCVWDLSSNKMLMKKSFNLWDIVASSTLVQASLGGNPNPKVTRVKWSSDGEYFGVAYEKHIVHVYKYLTEDVTVDLEIEADRGGVYDVAFTKHSGELMLITCGDEKNVKVWDSFSGAMKYQFDGHDDAVVSVSPQNFKGNPVIFAADLSGTLKIWSYKNTAKCQFSITLPQQVQSHIAFSGNALRVFVGGTGKDGVSCLAEVRVKDGVIKLAYDGLLKPAGGFVQYDIAKGKYVVANDASMIKFWKMDNKNIFEMTDAGGGLHPSGPIKVNNEGTFLAVATNDLCIKILANAAGQKFLKAKGKNVLDAPSHGAIVPVPNMSVANPFLETIAPGRSPFFSHNIRNDDGSLSMFNGNYGILKEPMALARNWRLKEIFDVDEMHCTRIQNKFGRKSVSWLAYAKSGRAILVLGANGEHRLWQWPKTDKNPDGKPTGQYGPTEWQAPDDLKMTNEVGYTNPDGHVSCFALPKNRHYVLSASGGKVSVYDIKTFKTLAKIMPPPPAATSMAIHPKDSNILVFGMEDTSIHIYHFRNREVSSKLIGHSKRVTGLAFSEVLNVLVSSGSDSRLCIWSMDEWKKLGSTLLQGQIGLPSDTRVEFNQDQIRLMAIHKTQLVIYKAPELIPLNSWVPQDVSSPITHAAYSCDGESIFVALGNGCVGILTGSSLVLKCKIYPTAYIPPNVRSDPLPVMVAASPSDPNQFALGQSDGVVVVMEPHEKEGMWGSLPVHEEAGTSEAHGVIDLDQLVWEDEEEDDDI